MHERKEVVIDTSFIALRLIWIIRLGTVVNAMQLVPAPATEVMSSIVGSWLSSRDGPERRSSLAGIPTPRLSTFCSQPLRFLYFLAKPLPLCSSTACCISLSTDMCYVMCNWFLELPACGKHIAAPADHKHHKRATHDDSNVSWILRWRGHANPLTKRPTRDHLQIKKIKIGLFCSLHKSNK
jgi:hypothetical protein